MMSWHLNDFDRHEAICITRNTVDVTGNWTLDVLSHFIFSIYIIYVKQLSAERKAYFSTQIYVQKERAV
jgi:hypothetical protein